MGPNRICSVSSTGDKSFYHSDHLGSSNIITNQAGNLIQNCEYLPYGEFSTKTGVSTTHYYFTGKELDDETGLMFYGARYYDPQLGRFITPDTVVQSPYDLQSLNRYSYCRNNPINLTDPTGHRIHWPKWRDIWQTAVSVITGVVSIFVPVLAPVMWAVNMGISAYTAIQTGNILGFAGGIVGGAVFGALGKSLSLGLAGMMSESFTSAFPFLSGAIVGAVEFGVGGFGAGLGAALASGESLKSSIRAAATGAAIGAVTGAIIEGSYRAGWQDKLHGVSNDQWADAQAKSADNTMWSVLKQAGNEAWKAVKEIALELIPGPIKTEIGVTMGATKALEECQYHYGQSALQVDMRYGFDPRYPSRIPEALTIDQYKAEAYTLKEWVKNATIVENTRN